MMLLEFPNLYRLLGTNKLKFFVTPRIIDQKTFKFCNNPMLYWFSVSDVPVNIDNTYPYLTTMEGKLYIRSVLEYTEEGNLGGFHKDNKISQTAAVENLIQAAPYFKFIKPSANDLRVNSKTLMVLNYGLLNTRYSYTSNVLNPYYKWHNAFLKMVSQVNSDSFKTDRHRFITFHIPPTLPTRTEMDKYAKKMLSGYLNYLPTFPYLNVVDLWKFLTPELKADSLLSKIPVSEYNNTTLLLLLDTKLVMLNLGLLVSVVSEYNFTSSYGKVSKIKAGLARKLVYVLLLKIITTAAKTAEAIITENDGSTDLVLTEKALKEFDSYGTDNKTMADIEETAVDIDHMTDSIMLNKPDVISKKQDETIINEDTGEEEEVATVVTSGELRELAMTVNDIEYTDIGEIYSKIPNPTMDVAIKIGALQDYGVFSKSKANRLTELISNQDQLPSPFPGDERSLVDVLDKRKDDYSLTVEDVGISDNPTVIDKESSKKILAAVTKKYVGTQLNKDIARVVYSLQSSDSVIESYNVIETGNIMGENQEHVFRLLPLDGEPSTVKVRLPKVSTDGTFKLSSNQYRLRWQRIDFPIRKTDATTVALTTNYGKVFIKKAAYKKDDVGYWLKNYLIGRYEKNDGVTDLILIPVVNRDYNLPQLYNQLSRYIKAFKVGDDYFSFDCKFRHTMFNTVSIADIKAVEKDKYILIGSSQGRQLYIDFNNMLHVYENKALTPYKSLYDVIGLSPSLLPAEYTSVKIFKRTIPTVLLLTYYVGLANIFNVLKTEYELADFQGLSGTGSKVRIRSRIPEGMMRIYFRNKILHIKRDYGYGDLILAGLEDLEDLLYHIDYETMLDATLFESVLLQYGLTYMYINEIKLMGNMFVDHISARLLESRKEPITFLGLLFRSNELLESDNYKHPNDISDTVIRGYERLPGMLYTEMVKAIRDHQNRSYWSKSKILLPDYKVIANIQDDSTTVLVDDLNPIASLKQATDITYMGAGGRSKEGMSKDTRPMHPSEVGIISEATKDSGDVGISAYMTASPGIADITGVTKKVDIENASWAELISDVAMLCPFAINDDPKRTNFASVQSSHIVPIKNSRVPYVRTGHEALIPIKVGGKFATIAEDNGVVKKLTPSEMIVTYEKLGDKRYPIYEWTTKEESGSCYTHELVPNMIAGATFGKDDTLLYDKLFFEPDIFNRKRVIYKQGTMVRVAVIDDTDTLEDSGGITKEASDMLQTRVTVFKSNVVNVKDNILNAVKRGDKVTPTTTLYSITDDMIGDVSQMDEQVMGILQELKMSSPKAELNGDVSNITVFYNCELEDMSPSLRELTNASDKQLLSTTGYVGRVNSSYSIEGRPLLPGSAQIKVYMETDKIMGVGDKAILANQLKFTVGTVADYAVTDIYGNPIHLWFASRSIFARIVPSPYLIGSLSTALEVLKDSMVKRWKDYKKK